MTREREEELIDETINALKKSYWVGGGAAGENRDELRQLIRTVTAESRKGGIEEMRDKMLQVFSVHEEEGEIIRDEAWRLKEQRK